MGSRRPDTLGSMASLLEAAAATPSAAVGLPPGTLIGERFRIVARIAIGGMGVVYRARDIELERDVAIKLHAWAAGGEARDRILREAVLMAQLSHPNVVTVYEVGPFADGVFIAMELVTGRTLRAWQRERARSWRELLAVYLDAGRGLAALHRAGLVHRDFKPDNVLVGDDGRVRIADLGLAGPPDQAERAGRRAGTPGYMAPEQLAGGLVDARADQHAFCVALTEALAGRRAPHWLRAAIARGLAQDAGDRYPSLAALLADLGRDRGARRRRLLAIGAVVALSALSAALLWERRAPRTCLLADDDPWDGATSAAVERAFSRSGAAHAHEAFAHAERALGGYVASWRAAARRVCDAPSDPLEDRRLSCLARRRDAVRALVSVMAAADRVAVEHSAAAVAALPELPRCDDPDYLLAQVKPPEPAIAAEARAFRVALALAEARYRAGQYAPALREAGELAARAAALRDPALEAEAYYLLGVVQDFDGQPAASEASLRRAFFAARRGDHAEIAALAATSLIDVVGYELVRYPEAELWSDYARAEVERWGRNTRAEAALHTELGLLATRRGRWSEAGADFRRALAVLRRIGEGEGIEAARVYTYLGGAAPTPAGAIAALRRALALRAKILPAVHPDNVNTLFMLAQAYDDAGREEIGVGYALAAAAVGERTLGRHPKTAVAYMILGDALLGLGDVTGALRALAEARAILEVTRSPDHPNVARLHSRLGLAYARAGQPAPALWHARRGLEIAQRALGPDHPDTAFAERSLGIVLLEQGRTRDALPALARARALAGDDAVGAAALGRCLIALGRPHEALGPLEQALATRLAEGAGPRLIAESFRERALALAMR